jgi:hypothetical protein
MALSAFGDVLHNILSSRDRIDLKHRVAEKQAGLPKGPWGIADTAM